MKRKKVDSAKALALELLSRREHSRIELRRKVGRRFAAEEVDGAIADLSELGLQSDERFCEAFVRSRVQRGQGPMKIRADLRERGVAELIIDDHLTFPTGFWLAQVGKVRSRRFGPQAPSEQADRARQARFLAQRGFPADVIYGAMREHAAEMDAD